jgi:cyanophycinase
MQRPIQPIYLLADSQLLFWKTHGVPFLAATLPDGQPADWKAAYIGASNGDAPEFYEIFREAMRSIAIVDCRHIHASFTEEDARFLDEADLLLLAGGDVATGWDAINRTGIAERIRSRYQEGATLIGVSAGAIQLGLYGSIELAEGAYQLVDTLKLVPFIIGTREEDRQWVGLSTVVQMLDGTNRGVGIRAGGGLVYHPNHGIEAIRYGVCEVAMSNGQLVQTLIFPAQSL